MENKHTLQELQTRQAMPLNLKIALTKQRIRDWVNYYGEEGVAISFSGGKDSTVLLDIARKMYPNLKAVYVDTGLEYPEIREFVKGFNNVDWLKPKMVFRNVIKKYGYPFISKEVSDTVDASRKYLTELTKRRESLQTDRQTDSIIPGCYGMADILGIERRNKEQRELYEKLKMGSIPDDVGLPVRIKMMFGIYEHKEKEQSTNEYSKMYDKSRYQYFLDAPFNISAMCCKVMKKSPVKKYHNETGRVFITGQMACESRLRTTMWLQHGCNAFDAKQPISNPLSFWTSDDCLLYIYLNKLPIAPVYGDVVIDYEAMGEVEGQMSFLELDQAELGLFEKERWILKTTGCNRTGCMFCGYGCQMEKPGEGRFERMKETHPKQYEYIMKPWEEGGLDYKNVIDWINEHNGKGTIIRY